MIVEFVGPTGSGKTTLAGQVRAALEARGVEVLSDFDAAFRAYGLPAHAVRAPLARTLAVDVLALPWGLLMFARLPRMLPGIAAVLARDVPSRLMALNIARNVVKRFGLHALAASRVPRAVVLQDEGPVQQAHSLFGHPERAPQAALVEWFGGAVPLPDLVVLVEATHEERVERTLARGHQRLDEVDRETVHRYLDHSERVFARLAAIPRLRARLVRAGDPPAAGADVLDAAALADRIATAWAQRGVVAAC